MWMVPLGAVDMHTRCAADWRGAISMALTRTTQPSVRQGRDLPLLGRK